MTSKITKPLSRTQARSAKAPVRKAASKAKLRKKANAASLHVLHDTLLKTQRMVAETREQVAFMYGVLEEIAQRQEIQSAWQIDLAKQMFAPPVSVSRGSKNLPQTSADFGGTEIELTAEITAGEGVPPALVGEITAAAEKILKSLSEKRKETKAQGIQAVQKILNEHHVPEEQSEPKIMVVPGKDEIH